MSWTAIETLLHSSRREDRICGILLSVKLIDEIPNLTEIPEPVSELHVLRTIFKAVGVKFVTTMASCLSNQSSPQYHTIGVAAVRILGAACKYEEFRTLDASGVQQLVELCFHEKLQNEENLCQLIFNIIKFFVCCSSQSIFQALEAILAKASNIKMTKPSTALRVVVDLIQIGNGMSTYFVSSNIHSGGLKSLLFQGIMNYVL